MGDAPDNSSLTIAFPGPDASRNDLRDWRMSVFKKWCKTKDPATRKGMNRSFMVMRDYLHLVLHRDFNASVIEADEYLAKYLLDPAKHPLDIEDKNRQVLSIRKGTESETYAALERRCRSRKCSQAVAEAWVANNITTPVTRIKYQDIPSPYALALLQQAKEDPKWFFEKVAAKTRSSGAASAKDGENGAADADLLETIQRVKALSALSAGSEGPEREP